MDPRISGTQLIEDYPDLECFGQRVAIPRIEHRVGVRIESAHGSCARCHSVSCRRQLAHASARNAAGAAAAFVTVIALELLMKAGLDDSFVLAGVIAGVGLGLEFSGRRRLAGWSGAPVYRRRLPTQYDRVAPSATQICVFATVRRVRISNRQPSLRSQNWFNDPENPGMTALYLERYLNYGLTPQELLSGKPIIGIAQTGSDLAPCNRIHVDLARRMRDGIRDGGGIPFEFPVHPIQETGRRPTAALDRNLAYLGLVEVLHGYPIDGVILTTGCDKTTPACLMAAATVDIPAIAMNGGPMLDGHWKGELAGAGTVLWEGRRMHAAGEIDYDEFLELASASAPSAGHCNTMGTALSMNTLAEALGMMLPGAASIPAPYRERGQMAYDTGRRIVEMVGEDLTPSTVMTREAFENAIVVNSAIGGSTNCPVHITAIARHVGVELDIEDWQTYGFDVPLIVNCQPAGTHLGEGFHRAGGLPAVMGELIRAGKINAGALTVSGKTMGELHSERVASDRDVIRTYDDPLMVQAGFVVLGGNLFDSAIMKTSVISPEFRERYLSTPGEENCFEGRAIVFEGPEDYHARINDPALRIDDSCLLSIRGVGPIGYPGSAEVVNMQPPDEMIKAGVVDLPTIGDGRQSGTSGSPSILNASPEAVTGSGLAILQTGDRVRIDLNARRVDVLIDDDEMAKRWEEYTPPMLEHQTPWQEIYRFTVGQLSTGGCMELATKYHQVRVHVPRHSH